MTGNDSALLLASMMAYEHRGAPVISSGLLAQTGSGWEGRRSRKEGERKEGNKDNA